MSQWKTEIKQVDHKVTVVNIVYKTIRATETQTKVSVEFRATLSASLNCYCGNKPPTNMWLLWPTSSLEFLAEDILSLTQLLAPVHQKNNDGYFWHIVRRTSLQYVYFLCLSARLSCRDEEGNNYYFTELFCGMLWCVIWSSKRTASES